MTIINVAIGIVVAAVVILILIFWRRIVSPQWNNRILICLWIATIVLFFTAIYKGGGEPLGLQALKQVANEPPAQSEIDKFYKSSLRQEAEEKAERQQPMPSAEPKPTWDWWKWWLASFILAIGFIPFAFWDEVRDAWHWAMEQAEQRRVVIDLRPPAEETGTGQTTPQAPPPPRPAPPSMWEKFKDHFPAILSANTLIEFGEGLVKRIVTDRVMRRIR